MTDALELARHAATAVGIDPGVVRRGPDGGLYINMADLGLEPLPPGVTVTITADDVTVAITADGVTADGVTAEESDR